MALYTPEWQERLTQFEQYLESVMPPVDTPQKTVSDAMAYACSAGGKRLRPMLVMEFARLCGSRNCQTALPYAAAIEMIHCYSLVHDDLPCMDNSLLRRGQPSTFAKYGEDMALLAGDGLLTFAFEVALAPQNVEAVGMAGVQATYVLAKAAGIEGMVGGQTIDLESEGKNIDLYTLQTLHKKKTGALITAACEMGAVLGGVEDPQYREAARTYGKEIGVAFQIVDDILDVTSTAAELGKPVGADDHNQKVTYVSLLGLEQARQFADDHTKLALKALDVFGEDAADLRVLTEKLLNRNM